MSSVEDMEYASQSLQQLDVLHACFKSTQAFFASFLSIPIERHYIITIGMLGQLFHAIGALYKLSQLDVPGWDVAWVRRTLDLSYVLERIAILQEAVANLYGPPSPVSPWSFCSRKMRIIKYWWDPSSIPEIDPGVQSMNANVYWGPAPQDMDFDFLDDSFWHGFGTFDQSISIDKR